ncbi:hypothetical protein V6Z11_1Z110000 [Gossypium hirsutum]
MATAEVVTAQTAIHEEKPEEVVKVEEIATEEVVAVAPATEPVAEDQRKHTESTEAAVAAAAEEEVKAEAEAEAAPVEAPKEEAAKEEEEPAEAQAEKTTTE